MNAQWRVQYQGEANTFLHYYTDKVADKYNVIAYVRQVTDLSLNTDRYYVKFGYGPNALLEVEVASLRIGIDLVEARIGPA